MDFFPHLFHRKKNNTLLVKTLVHRNYWTIFMFRHDGKIIGLNPFVFYSNVIIRKKYVSTTTSITIYHYYQMYCSVGIKLNIMELWTLSKKSNSIRHKSKLFCQNPQKKPEINIFSTRKRTLCWPKPNFKNHFEPSQNLQKTISFEFINNYEKPCIWINYFSNHTLVYIPLNFCRKNIYISEI